MKRLSSGYIYVVCFVPTAFKNMHQMNDILFFYLILDDMIMIIIGLLALMGHLLNLIMATPKGGAVKYKNMSLCLLTLEIKGNSVLISVLMVMIVLWF